MKELSQLNKTATESQKERANRKERQFAKKFGGRPTICSGSLKGDKADIKIKNVRVEHKHTIHESLTLEKTWLIKLRNACRLNEIPALAIDINNEEWVLIRPSEFAYIISKMEEDNGKT